MNWQAALESLGDERHAVRPSEGDGSMRDTDSIPELMGHLETVVRDWRRLGPDNVSLTDYELQVRSLERSWVEFTVAGDPSVR